jgi:hypothetical protein
MVPNYAYIPTAYQSKSNPYSSNLAKFGLAKEEMGPQLIAGVAGVVSGVVLLLIA